MTFSVSEVARKISYSPSQVRNFTRTFEDFLSDDTRPAAGDQRRYNEDDLAVLATVANLKREKKSNEAILAVLDAGDLVNVQPETVETPPEGRSTTGDTSALLTQREAQLSTMYANLEGKYNAIELERDFLRDQLNEERQDRVKAEKEAAHLAGQLTGVYRRHWYQFWKPERPEEDD